jgi:hypothetical protein
MRINSPGNLSELHRFLAQGLVAFLLLTGLATGAFAAETDRTVVLRCGRSDRIGSRR